MVITMNKKITIKIERNCTLRKCCVPKCNNNSKLNMGMTFFRIPKAKERYSEWLKCINRHDLLLDDPVEINKHLVCEKHFQRKMLSINEKRDRLHSGAIPTLNIPPPLCEQGTQTTPTSEMDIVSAIKTEEPNIESVSVMIEEVNEEKGVVIKEEYEFTESSFNEDMEEDFVLPSTSYAEKVNYKLKEQGKLHEPNPGKILNKSDELKPDKKPNRFKESAIGEAIENHLVIDNSSLQHVHPVQGMKSYNPDVKIRFMKTKATTTADLQKRILLHKCTMTEDKYIERNGRFMERNDRFLESKRNINTELQQFYTLCDKFLDPEMSESVKLQAFLKHEK